MDWKTKAKKHEELVKHARSIANALKALPIYQQDEDWFNSDSQQPPRLDEIFTRTIADKHDNEKTKKAPTCKCKDDGDRAVRISPFQLANGKYQLKIQCVLCMEEGQEFLKWDEFTETDIIAVFTNHFLQN